MVQVGRRVAIQDEGALGAPRLEGAPRSRPAAFWWAMLGAGCLVVAAYVWLSWIVTGDAKATTTGSDPVGTSTKVWAWTFQGLSVAALAVVVTYIVRKWKREGRMPFDAMLVIGFFCVFWQDSICNYLRPMFFYNSYLVNLGGWDPHIPGWIAPNHQYIPEPLLFAGPIWGWWFLTFAVTFGFVGRWARKRWPTMGKLGIFAIGFLVLGLFDMVLELTFVRSGLYAYSGVIRGLSLWGGKTYQFPLYEAVMLSAVMCVPGMLRL